MDPKTGETIPTILRKRVPHHPAGLALDDGEVVPVHRLDAIGRDLGASFDNFQINFSEADRGLWRFLRTDEVWRIVEPETGTVIFDAHGDRE